MFNENELKISLSEKEYEFIKSVADVKPATQKNYYFDTTDDLGRMVRIREKNGNYALQYKARKSIKNNVFNAEEYGVPVELEFFKNAVEHGLDKNFVNGAFGCSFDRDLKYLGCGETERIKFDYFGFIIELDKIITESSVDYELEYEGDDESINRLINLLKKKQVKIRPSITKFERFLKAKGIL